ncbi:VOC family protein [Nocardioides sp. C4-1]|uniref:VOC family protein n=1 Tax=Nocardioides sp. C4-1 TaxID=3151851 RepID=UPI003264E2E8
MSSPVLKMTTLDCADVRAQTAFWSGLLGWQVAHEQDEYAMLVPGDGGDGGRGAALGFGQVPDYQPPSWPDAGGRKQFHFDLACDDLAATEARALELGATLADPQPGETWRVLLDPAGHPFCLTDAANW